MQQIDIRVWHRIFLPAIPFRNRETRSSETADAATKTIAADVCASSRRDAGDAVASVQHSCLLLLPINHVLTKMKLLIAVTVITFAGSHRLLRAFVGEGGMLSSAGEAIDCVGKEKDFFRSQTNMAMYC